MSEESKVYCYKCKYLSWNRVGPVCSVYKEKYDIEETNKDSDCKFYKKKWYHFFDC